MALEVYIEEPDTDTDDAEDQAAASSRPTSSREDSIGLSGPLSKLSLKSPSNSPAAHNGNQLLPAQLTTSPTKQPQIKTSLSLLEMLLKLTALQQFRQESHLSISDELLNFFLEDSATAGAGGDKSARRRIRRDAMKRVGFDPYDESPVKRRGEEYIAHAHKYQNGGGFEELALPEFVHPTIEDKPGSSPGYSIPSNGIEVPSSPSPAMRHILPSSSPPTNPMQATKTSSKSSLLATPPSSGPLKKSWHGLLRAPGEAKESSPLARECLFKDGRPEDDGDDDDDSRSVET
jgi:hypothetical protein